MSYECHVDCSLSKDGICEPAKLNGVGMCNLGRFAALVERELSGFGSWKLREYQNGAICATLHGRAGRVEVWGGDGHMNEVWFIEKGTKKETLICKPWKISDDSLTYAVANGCAMAGTQTALSFGALELGA